MSGTNTASKCPEPGNRCDCLAPVNLTACASGKTYQRTPSDVLSSFLGAVYSATFLTFSLIHLPQKTNQNHLIIINISPSSIKRLFYRTLKTIPPINTHAQCTHEACTPSMQDKCHQGRHIWQTLAASYVPRETLNGKQFYYAFHYDDFQFQQYHHTFLDASSMLKNFFIFKLCKIISATKPGG